MRKEIFEMEQALAKAGYSPHVFEVLYANYFRNEKDLRKRVDKLLEHAIIIEKRGKENGCIRGT